MLMPAYNLLGYSLNEVKYINSHKDNTYIGISIPNESYNKATFFFSKICHYANNDRILPSFSII